MKKNIKEVVTKEDYRIYKGYDKNGELCYVESPRNSYKFRSKYFGAVCHDDYCDITVERDGLLLERLYFFQLGKLRKATNKEIEKSILPQLLIEREI